MVPLILYNIPRGKLMLFAVGCTTLQAAQLEVLVVVGVDLLAELLLQVVGSGLLDEGVFGVGTHTATSPSISRGRRRLRACTKLMLLFCSISTCSNSGETDSKNASISSFRGSTILNDLITC